MTCTMATMTRQCALFRRNTINMSRSDAGADTTVHSRSGSEVAFMNSTKITSARAQVADCRALSRLLDEVPDADIEDPVDAAASGAQS